jgi:hypothetical protein
MLQVQLESAALPLGELELLGHARHAVSSVAPVLVEYLPAPQSVHATLPLVVLYFPATQAAHEPPLGPVNPRLQEQLESAALPLGELVFLRQTIHLFSTVSPVLVEY